MEEMTPEDLFHTLLGLGTQWRVLRCEFAAKEGTVRLWIEETPYLWNGESITMQEAVTAYDPALLAAEDRPAVAGLAEAGSEGGVPGHTPTTGQPPPSYGEQARTFFDRARFLTLLREWILFYTKDDELRKTVLRQHQTRAVEKVIARCLDGQKTRGLVWHTQGSGKTFTMITAARLLLSGQFAGTTPTVLLIVDRNELEGQLSGWVERLLGELKGVGISVEPAYSRDRLRELLAADFRGLILTMIHKFDQLPARLVTRPDVYPEDRAKALAVEIEVAYARFPNAADNADEHRQLKADIYKTLLRVVSGKKMIDLADRIMAARIAP